MSQCIWPAVSPKTPDNEKSRYTLHFHPLCIRNISLVISVLTDDLPDLMLIRAEKLSGTITVLFILWYTLTNAE